MTILLKCPMWRSQKVVVPGCGSARRGGVRSTLALFDRLIQVSGERSVAFRMLATRLSSVPAAVLRLGRIARDVAFDA